LLPHLHHGYAQSRVLGMILLIQGATAAVPIGKDLVRKANLISANLYFGQSAAWSYGQI
jgi:hypothetical protein